MSKQAELVNTAMNRKTWEEKMDQRGYFIVPYNSIYREVAAEWVDRVEWENYAPRGMIVTPESQAGFLAACAERVAHYEKSVT